MSTFEIGTTDFLLDGNPYQIRSGAIHYFRVPREYWADRIDKARRMGLNTVETYVAWNFHSERPGAFSLEGERDLAHFLDLIHEAGMQAIVRPGPFICAEWDGGGLPAWLNRIPDMQVRSSAPAFIGAVTEYFDAILPLVAERQITRGGPVIMVQIENEYGAYGNEKDYLRTLVALNRGHGIDVPLFTCDQPTPEMLENGSLPELFKTATFGSRAKERFEALRQFQPTGPLMVAEFWNGWFDWWGEFHHDAAPEANTADLKDIMEMGASFNLYMFHGGTNFGFWAGANDKGIYQPTVTSYDYDAPLSESGAITDKYHSMRAAISAHTGEEFPIPETFLPSPRLTVTVDRMLPYLKYATQLNFVSTVTVPTFDELAHYHGLVDYQLSVPDGSTILTFEEVRDYAIAFANGIQIGCLDRSRHQFSLQLPPGTKTVHVLVEAHGRVNYGPLVGEEKGLIGPVLTDQGEIVTAAVAPLNSLPPAPDTTWTKPTTPTAGPAFFHAKFNTHPTQDHFLRLDGWGKGLVWVNGHLLGRYWAAGPTRTLYVPAPWLSDSNEIIIFEELGVRLPQIEFVESADLGPVDW